ncbi:MAG: hypothetical protein JO261_07260 [Alphaproteobacteria bacterium]|nr:hypothetical protein [Alphaproteobacteria bacterium]MBV9693479.1 hypothetical protein [Alphaproteobacteria bacterium]
MTDDDLPSPPEDEEGLPESLGRTVGCFSLIAVFFVAAAILLWMLIR